MKAWLGLALIALAVPVAAAATGEARPPAAQLGESQRDSYRAVFAAIRAQQWDAAAARLDAMAEGPLHAVARAELYLAKGSPAAETGTLSTLIERAPDLPHAPQLAALLRRQGGELVLPTLPAPRTLTPVRGAPRRLAARSNKADQAAARLAQRIKPLIKEDRAGEMEGLLLDAQDQLSADARTEWQQRIAWSYYLAGDDENALRLALAGGRGSGDFAAAASWVAGLAAWRLDRCDPAGRAFAAVQTQARDDEMRAAGAFWLARADLACRRPERVQAALRQAAAVPETFYGLLASRALGIAPPPPVKRASLAAAGWNARTPHSNGQAAVALAEIGELALADRLLRWQARIGPAIEHRTLIDLAAGLDLPQAQVWLAHNTPNGLRPDPASRYPRPGWTPRNGWQVDRSLVFAHSLEESVFRVGATSGAGARGLMGIMPGTADQLDRREGLPTVDRAALNDPLVNMAYGQRMLTWLRDLPSTGGLLPKIIAAYNAGPGANIKWNPRLRDRGDPLLWIESIPYIETRAYVGLVLRNYWMYQRQGGEKTASLHALAQGMWPRFPGLAGQQAVRVQMPAQPPVRLAVVMPVKAPPPVRRIDYDADETMLAGAPHDATTLDSLSPPATSPALKIRTAIAKPAAVLPAKARAGERPAQSNALAGASASAGAKSVTAVKRVVRTLSDPVVRAQASALPGRGLDGVLGPVLAKELPRARAGTAAAARSLGEAVRAKVSAKVGASGKGGAER